MTSPCPPRLFLRFFEWYCRDGLQETILGDLEEQFDEDVQAFGLAKARRRFAWNVIRFFRPGIVRSLKGTQKLNSIDMFRNYFKVSMRNILRNKTFSALNVTGLSVGIASCILIMIYVQNELSYDTYNQEYSNTYRVIHDFGDDKFQVWGNAPVAPALQRDFPEVKKVFRFTSPKPWLIEYGSQRFAESNIVFADSTAFEVFSWDLVAGNPETALSRPKTIVLSKELAKKYFGDKNPIGETLQMDGRIQYEVTGVMDIPENTHIDFDAMISMNTFYNMRPSIFDSWDYVDFYTYFVLEPNASIDQLSKKIPDFVEANCDVAFRYDMRFEPLTEAYLQSKAGRQPGVTGSLTNIYVFTSVALFILLIACINFMNLSTARSVERAKEVAIRKTIGSNRQSLVAQFLVETILLTTVSTLIAAVLIYLNIPLLEQVTGKSFSIDWLLSIQSIGIAIAGVLLLGLLAGSYPAMMLSGFKPIQVLKGSFKNSSQGVWLRKSLVVLQFSLSIILLVGVAVVYSQLSHLRKYDLGFNQEHVLVIDYGWDANVQRQLKYIKSELAKHPDVTNISASRATPGDFFPNAGTGIEDALSGEIVYQDPAIYEIDEDFVPTYQMEVVAGRGFSKDFPLDSANALLLNESAAKLYGYQDPKDIVGKSFRQWEREGKVIGVIKDFNYTSLHQAIEPLSLRYATSNTTAMLSLRLNTDDYARTLGELEELWNHLAPQYPFNAHFNNTNFNNQYEADEQFGMIFSVFSGLAMLVACLGLFGLTIYSTAQRTKEIGVRKVLGASTQRIVTLLSLDFVKLFGISLLIAIPVSWYAMNTWLDSFAYRITIGWGVFGLATFITLLVALITMSFKTISAALSNPVESLRDE